MLHMFPGNATERNTLNSLGSQLFWSSPDLVFEHNWAPIYGLTFFWHWADQTASLLIFDENQFLTSKSSWLVFLVDVSRRGSSRSFLVVDVLWILCDSERQEDKDVHNDPKIAVSS